MTIGADISSVLQELGTPITIYKPDGTIITGEYLDYDNYYEQSTDFIRQNVYSGDFQYDSQIDFGDILDMDGIWVLVTNVKVTKFEQAVVIKNGFLVETNCLGHFARGTKTRVNMEPVMTWTPTVQNVRALQLDDVGNRDPLIRLSDEVTSSVIDEYILMSKLDNIRVGDRWFPDSTDTSEYYRVVYMTGRKYKNCYKIFLDYDKRE